MQNIVFLSCNCEQENTFSPGNKQAMEAAGAFVRMLASATSSPRALATDALHIDRLLNAERLPCEDVSQSLVLLEKLKTSPDASFVIYLVYLVVCLNMCCIRFVLFNLVAKNKLYLIRIHGQYTLTITSVS